MSDEEATAVLGMMGPFIQALPPAARAQARKSIATEAKGVFRWAVESGYLLWSRQHPGETPTQAQMGRWMAQFAARATGGE